MADGDSLADDLGSLASLLERVAGTEPPGLALGLGALVGEKYRIERRLGAGGMGVVYLARDATLDRLVALKLCTTTAPDALERLQREAIALAKLSHPNVVVIHDVGMHEGRVFIAMEHVAGGTARAWAKEAPRTWREILALYLGAADGLAAAHRAGIVHRDFKPDNMLIGADGRVRVADFGLARDAATLDPSLSDGPDRPRDDLERVTRTGVAAGTPAYMAPEQFQAGDVDGRADQFGFCVALWEALFGTRPFAGAVGADLRAAITKQAIDPPPTRRGVPAAIERVLRRGLRAEPDRRYPTMASLIAALRRAASRNTRRVAAAVAGVAVVAATGLALATRGGAPPPRCGELDTTMATAWGAPQRDAVRATVRRTGTPFAVAAADQIVAALDRHARAWGEVAHEVCEAVRVRGEWPPALLDRSLGCLGRRRADLVAAVDVLASADVAGYATDVIEDLGDPTVCGDRAWLEAAIPPPAAAEQPAVEVVQASIAHAAALARAGKLTEARTEAQRAVADAGSLSYRPVHAEALHRLGAIQKELFEEAAAFEQLGAGYHEARALRWHALAATAAMDAAILSSNRGAIAEAERWLRFAEVELDFAPPEIALDARFLEARATILFQKNGLDAEALEATRAALALWRQSVGPNRDESVAGALATLADRLDQTGDYEEAITVATESLAALEQLHGDVHPDLVRPLGVLARAHSMLGHHAEAEAAGERGLAIARAVFPGDSVLLAFALENQTSGLLYAGQSVRAEAVARQALEVLERTLGPEHPTVTTAVNALASVTSDLGRHAEAEALYRRALALSTARFGANSRAVATVHGNLGNTIAKQGRFQDAKIALEQSVAVWEALGPDTAETGFALTALGQVYDVLDESPRAIPLLERAVAVRVAANVDPARIAQSEDALLRVRYNVGDVAGALALLPSTRAHAAAAGADAMVKQLDELRAMFEAELAAEKR